MVSENPFSFSSRSPTPKLCSSFTTRIFSDVAGDITIVVDGESFLLHKVISSISKMKNVCFLHAALTSYAISIVALHFSIFLFC